MTLVEFIAPLKESAHRDKVLAVLYYEGSSGFRVGQPYILWSGSWFQGLVSPHVDAVTLRPDPLPWRALGHLAALVLPRQHRPGPPWIAASSPGTRGD
jgi:hypothetical protein